LDVWLSWLERLVYTEGVGGSNPSTSTMDNTEKEYTFLLTEMEAAYLNAAVVDFFHKMKSAAEEKTVVLFTDDRYRIAKDLWMKIEKQIPIL